MEKIGKYEIREQLGRGGMGAVYRAYDPVMEREVAIKVILDTALDVPELKERFYREARTAGKLTHENITIVHDVGEENGRPFIVMEYLTGTDLRTLLEHNEPMTLPHKLECALQICRGLAYSHAKDIIHRDVKPANIRILDNGRVKIMDFGIARLGSSSLTSTGTVMGTPYYMSPEQIQGKKVDRRADIFSCGVLLYELFASHKPFSGEEPTTVMYKIVHEEPEGIRDLGKSLPSDLPAILEKMLKKESADRYQTMDEVVAALESVQSALKVEEEKKSKDLRKKTEKLFTEVRISIHKRRWHDAEESLSRAAALDPYNSQIPRIREEIANAEQEARKRAESLQSALTIVSTESPSPALSPPTQKPRRKRTTIVLALSSVALVIGAVVLYALLSPTATGAVALNVLPWGQITKIQGENGTEVALDDVKFTPCRIMLPPGTYTVTLSNPQYSQLLSITLVVIEDSLTEVKQEWPGYNADKFLSQY